jgi:hypothetical protein
MDKPTPKPIPTLSFWMHCVRSSLHQRKGIFIGYTAAWDNIRFIDIQTNREMRAKYVVFDEASLTRQQLTLGSRLLVAVSGRDPTNYTSEASAMTDIERRSHPYSDIIKVQFGLHDTINHGFQFTHSAPRNRIYVSSTTRLSPGA